MEASTSSAVAPVSASAVEAVRLTVVVPVDVMSTDMDWNETWRVR